MRPAALLFALGFLVQFALGETLITEAKILQVTERGFILKVGTDPLAVEDGPETKFWSAKSSAKRDTFKEGDLVFARVKTDADPPILREMADKASWQWLDSLRKTPTSGTIDKIDPKYLTLKLGDGSSFSFRATNKTQVKLNGKESSLGQLEAGMKVHAKGRTLANLDTWLVLITDQPIPAKTTAKAAKKAKVEPIPESGRIECRTLGHFPVLKMFDIIAGVRTLHISYNLSTKWFLDGVATKSSALRRDLDCIVTYRRDRAGRILATKVELFTGR